MKGTWDGDRDPLAALRRGQPDLFEAFVRAEAASMMAFFRRLGAAQPESEDLTQDVFIKLYRSAQDYEVRGSFDAYVLRVARNAWIDRGRRRGARVEAGPLAGPEGTMDAAESQRSRAPDVADDPGRALEVREEVQRLHRALRELPDTQREVFELAVLAERPYAEIAQALDIPVGTVKSRVFHAVRRLRALLEEVGTGPADREREVRP